MRSLTRPFLFAVVRLGLFIAVVAWIAGQRWEVDGTMVGGPVERIAVSELGWTATNRMPIEVFFGSGTIDWIAVVPHRMETRDWFGDYHHGQAYCSRPWRVPGLSFQHLDGLTSGYYWGLAVRHWFIVLLLCLWHVGLSRVYRKREPVDAGPVTDPGRPDETEDSPQSATARESDGSNH